MAGQVVAAALGAGAPGWARWACPLHEKERSLQNLAPLGLKCAVYSDIRLRIPPTPPPQASLNEMVAPIREPSARAKSWKTQGARRLTGGGNKSRCPSGSVVPERCLLAVSSTLSRDLRFPGKKDSFTFTCGLRLRNFQPLPLLTPVSKMFTPRF